MPDSDTSVRFIDNLKAQELFAAGLHSVEVRGPICYFTFYVEKRDADGELYREPSFSFWMPTEAINPAIALTLKTIGTDVVVPAANEAIRRITRLLH